MNWRSMVQGMCVVAFAWALAPVEARAGDRDAVADAVSRTMEAANTRMKAAMEEARLLEAAGRRDEALATLRTIPKLYDEALRAVRSLVGGPDAARRAAAVEEPRRAPLVVRVSPPRAQPVTDPVPAAVAYLLRCQDATGSFDPRRGAAPEDAPIPPTLAERIVEDATGAALLALLDVAGSRVDPRSDVGAAILRGADALLARVGPTPGGPSPLAGWALATTLSRTGDARYLPAVARAVEGALSDLAPTLGRDFPSSLPDLAIDAALLHECLALSIDDAMRTRIEGALAEVTATVRALKPEALRTPAARLARDLLVRSGDRQGVGRLERRDDVFSSADARPGARLDGLELLFGTMYARAAYGFDDEAEGRAFWDGVLVPTMDAQVDHGPFAGSWGPPGGAARTGGSRLQTTAWMLLAWKVPTTPFFHPVAMRAAPPDADDADDTEDDGR
ncbi:MAG: hypothetical protein JNM10_06260 [Planctomycetia bacterium]|nr:hypothetical protein [Planctomycetia bacterium]